MTLHVLPTPVSHPVTGLSVSCLCSVKEIGISGLHPRFPCLNTIYETNQAQNQTLAQSNCCGVEETLTPSIQPEINHRGGACLIPGARRTASGNSDSNTNTPSSSGWTEHPLASPPIPQAGCLGLAHADPHPIPIPSRGRRQQGTNQQEAQEQDPDTDECTQA